MEILIFKSNDVAKSGFIVFYDDKLIFIKPTKALVKDTNKRLKQDFKEHNQSILAMLMYTDDLEYWEKFPDQFSNMTQSEIQELHPDVILLDYADIRKFKLSSSSGLIFDEGVQTSYPGELLIKGNGEKIAMDHDYESNHPVYRQVRDLRKRVI